jgi:beta-galactosidase
MNRYAILFIITILISGLKAAAQEGRRFFPEEDLITTGIYYYPEHWTEGQWERDIKKIAGMGYEFVHLAEFAWFKMEPEEEKFEFNWLDKVIALCTKRLC